MIVTVEGKGGIKVSIIQDSISPAGKRITTFELEYHRYIHAEFMTHRQFSRNAASSRAIPVDRMHQLIQENMATPVVWQKNQAGMQSSVDLEGLELDMAKREWRIAGNMALDSSKALLNAGLHKQWANRPTEAFQMMKVVVTATEWENFFWLRNHPDAQPEIHELARCMLEAHTKSSPMPINPGEWHVPYVKRERVLVGQGLVYSDSQGTKLTVEEAKIISASCCAQVSYRKSDDTIDKARAVYTRLIGSEPVHASPVEHQAVPMRSPHQPVGQYFEAGTTHVDRGGLMWSGNFQGWIQLRQLIPNHSK